MNKILLLLLLLHLKKIKDHKKIKLDLHKYICINKILKYINFPKEEFKTIKYIYNIKKTKKFYSNNVKEVSIYNNNNYVVKTPVSYNRIDLYIEYIISKELKKTNIPIVKILDKGEEYQYIVRPKLDGEYFGDVLLKKNKINDEKKRELYFLFNHCKTHTVMTGITFNLEPNNLWWCNLNKKWILVNTNMLEGKYKFNFSLNLKNFDEYYDNVWANNNISNIKPLFILKNFNDDYIIMHDDSDFLQYKSNYTSYMLHDEAKFNNIIVTLCNEKMKHKKSTTDIFLKIELFFKYCCDIKLFCLYYELMRMLYGYDIINIYEKYMNIFKDELKYNNDYNIIKKIKNIYNDINVIKDMSNNSKKYLSYMKKKNVNLYNSIKLYTDYNECGLFNAYLRDFYGNKANSLCRYRKDKESTDDDNTIIKHIEKNIRNMYTFFNDKNIIKTSKEIILYRRVNQRPFYKPLDYSIDHLELQQGLLSSSFKSIKHYGDILYKYIIPKGVPYCYVESITNAPNEQEILFPMGYTLRLIKKEDGKPYINNEGKKELYYNNILTFVCDFCNMEKLYHNGKYPSILEKN